MSKEFLSIFASFAFHWCSIVKVSFCCILFIRRNKGFENNSRIVSKVFYENFWSIHHPSKNFNLVLLHKFICCCLNNARWRIRIYKRIVFITSPRFPSSQMNNLLSKIDLFNLFNLFNQSLIFSLFISNVSVIE